MADRLVAIRKLLTHEQEDRRRAAAIVMTELGVTDKRSLNALTRTLDDEYPQVRKYVIEALGRSRDESVIDALIVGISDQDAMVQLAAEQALLQFGDVAVPALQALLEGPAAIRRRAASVLGQVESSAGIDSLIESVDGSDATVLDRARQALRSQASDMPLQDLRSIRKRLEQRLNDTVHGRGNSKAAALLQLLGDLPDDTVVTRIVQEVGPEIPPIVRKAALAATMSALPRAHGRRREAAIDKLLDCLVDKDEDGVVRPALRALNDVELPDRLTTKLEAIVEAPTTAARAWALAELGRLGSPDSVTTLVRHLVIGTAPVRAAARDALAGVSAAAKPLAQAMLDVSDPARLSEIGELLRGHRDALSPRETKRLCAAAVDLVEDDGEDVGALVETLARALPSAFITEIRSRVDAHRDAERIVEAHELLVAIKDCQAFGASELYVLAILGLLRSSIGKGRQPRAGDRTCAPFSELLRKGFPLESRLRAEASLELRELFFLGFAFSESRDEEERDFGHELLEEVADRDPESKFGARATNKLKLTRR